MGYVNIPTPPVDTTYLMKTNDENELTQDFSKVAGARTATRENIWNRKFNIDPVGIYYRTSHGIKIVVPLQNDRDMIKYKFEYSDQWGNYVASGEIWCLYSTNYYYSKVGGYVTGDFPFGEILIGTGSSGEWIVYISSRETRNAQFRITEATGFNHKHVDNDYSYLVDVPTVTATTSSGITSSSNYPGSIAPIAKAANSFGTSAAYGGNSMLVNKGTTYPSGTAATRKYEIKLPELIDASTTSTWGVQLEIETYDAIVGNGKATIGFRYSAHYNTFYDYSYVWEGKSYPVMNDL
ncbi:MAG: hypothetical protein U9O94_00185, partial [Nanoarchaeota archaeon]|nr:hypothetical protein [Nanoarchaeota archaeon]